MAARDIELTDNVVDFNRRLNEAMQALPNQANKIKRVAAVTVLRGVIFRSPVDTGRFRNNWQLTLGRPARGEVNAGGYFQAAASGTARALQAKPGQDIWITNNVPYAEALEEGHSGQAPAGVVGPTLAGVAMGLRLDA